MRKTWRRITGRRKTFDLLLRRSGLSPHLVSAVWEPLQNFSAKQLQHFSKPDTTLTNFSTRALFESCSNHRSIPQTFAPDLFSLSTIHNLWTISKIKRHVMKKQCTEKIIFLFKQRLIVNLRMFELLTTISWLIQYPIVGSWGQLRAALQFSSVDHLLFQPQCDPVFIGWDEHELEFSIDTIFILQSSAAALQVVLFSPGWWVSRLPRGPPSGPENPLMDHGKSPGGKETPQMPREPHLEPEFCIVYLV